ncbi:unnamed protein product [Hyaloperonospora brassicae]|uniref:FYVE-type domain-containing protein n=1 Tax=Hyaloperonospora brassicae TaxID=162125 RepID=A0AAV0TEE5_HYABA|nr:unnamed protein product [Hyaloperonospora brassicae]
MAQVCTNCGASRTTNRSKFCSECGQRFLTDSHSSSLATPPGDGSVPLVASAFRASTSAFGGQTYRHAPNGSTNDNNNNNNANNYNSGNSTTAMMPPFSSPVVEAHPVPPLGGKSAAPPSAFRTRSHTTATAQAPNTVRFALSSDRSSSPSLRPMTVEMLTDTTDDVPPAATGADALQLYEQCVQTMRASKGGQNDHAVKTFKHNCRQFGLHEMTVERFYASLVAELGARDTGAFVPTLARLVPDDDRRKELVQYNAAQQRLVPGAFTGTNTNSSSNGNGNGSSHTRSFSFRNTNNNNSSNHNNNNSNGQRPPAAIVNRTSSMTESDAGAMTKKGVLNNRYADHPNCDVCHVRFDVTKRRHQCRLCAQYICSACSPVRLLVPPSRVIEGAKKYDASIPQRVCIQCAPELHPLQDELVATYAQSQTDNVHEARGRLHIPFTTSLNKECCNAADVIGNFFRNDWGSSADRAIPVAFLQKAHGLAVLTVIKAGFLVSGTIGTGLVVAKLPDGSWSAPSAIGTFGLSGGFEIGGELIEVMIILGSEGAVKVFHKPQVSLGAGLDLAVGPFGRSAQAAAAASTSGLNANYSYSHSKGLYAGISLQGAIVAARSDMNRKFYGRDLQPSELLSGYVEQPAAARPLYEAIDNAMRGIANHKEEQQRRSSLMGPCRLCNCPMFQAHSTQVWNKKCKSCKHAH